MKIIELIQQKKPFLSLEFFPPKERETWPKFFATAEKLAALDPLFVSVTYGAGGGTQDNTLDIVAKIKKDIGLEPMAHLTCVGATRDRILSFVDQLRDSGVNNILALRGDPPRDVKDFDFADQEFQHGSDLVTLVKKERPDMGVAVTSYPEPHTESPSIAEDLSWSKYKVQAGGDFMVTQLFFDNRLYFDMVERLKSMGTTAPAVPGVLPILSLKSA